MDKRELEILISTSGEARLRRLSEMNLPRTEGVGYVISCQCPGDSALTVPCSLQRPDIKVVFTPTCGVALNRNNALRYATAPVCLIADDDVTYTHEAFSIVLDTFRNNPGLDIATFMYTGPEGTTEKVYPSHPFHLSRPTKGYYITAFEIAFRLASVKERGIWFNENFGVGNPRFGAGEEDIWIYDLLKAGLNGWFFPHIIAIHNHCHTTGIRLMNSPAVLRAQGAVITRLYPFTALPRVLLKAWRVSRASETPLSACLSHLLYGWYQATLHARTIFDFKYKPDYMNSKNLTDRSDSKNPDNQAKEEV